MLSFINRVDDQMITYCCYKCMLLFIHTHWTVFILIILLYYYFIILIIMIIILLFYC